MAAPSSIGLIIDAHDIEFAVIDTLRLWMPTYLAELERQRDIPPGSLPPVRTFSTRPRLESWPEESLPLLLVVSPGMLSTAKEGRGTYRGKWRADIACICSANTEENSNRVAKLYGAAVRTALLQQPRLEGALDGNVRGTEWLGEDYDDLDPNEERAVSAARVISSVEVANVVNVLGGKDEPESPGGEHPGPGQWPTVKPDGTEVTVEALP